jgi:hypothetical protein
VFIVSCYEWSFANHPRCRRFNSLAEAVEAITAAKPPVQLVARR